MTDESKPNDTADKTQPSGEQGALRPDDSENDKSKDTMSVMQPKVLDLKHRDVEPK